LLNPHDRRDLACLGLLVLVYGLAMAPVLHAVVGHGGGGARHEHAHVPGERAHSHDAPRDASDAPEDGRPGQRHGPDGHQHLTGSVEHLHAVAATWAVVEAPRVRAVSWLAEVLRGPARAPGAATRLTAMPQGP
jgi:hypothetical protein